MSQEPKPPFNARKAIIGALVAFIVVLIVCVGFREPHGPPLPDCTNLIGKRLANIDAKQHDTLVIPEQCAKLAPNGTIPPAYSSPTDGNPAGNQP